MLVIVNVAGSCGPLHVTFNENDKVEGVIKATLREYARQGRLPFLSSNVHHYNLFPSNPPDSQGNQLSSMKSHISRSMFLVRVFSE